MKEGGEKEKRKSPSFTTLHFRGCGAKKRAIESARSSRGCAKGKAKEGKRRGGISSRFSFPIVGRGRMKKERRKGSAGIPAFLPPGRREKGGEEKRKEPCASLLWLQGGGREKRALIFSLPLKNSGLTEKYGGREEEREKND